MLEPTDSQEDEVKHEDDDLVKASVHFAVECNVRSWNYLTHSYFGQIALPPTLRVGMKKADMWMRFKECPYWLDVGARKNRKKTWYLLSARYTAQVYCTRRCHWRRGRTTKSRFADLSETVGSCSLNGTT